MKSKIFSAIFGRGGLASVLLLSLLLSSCRPKLKKAKPASLKMKDIEARLYDVPFFVQACLDDSETIASEHQVGPITFSIGVGLHDVVSFYQKEMDWFGWDCIGISSNEGLAFLAFEKPMRFCFIFATFLGACKTKVVVATGQKENK